MLLFLNHSDRLECCITQYSKITLSLIHYKVKKPNPNNQEIMDFFWNCQNTGFHRKGFFSDLCIMVNNFDCIHIDKL